MNMSLATAIYPLQELIKIEILAFSSAFMWQLPDFQVLFIITAILMNLFSYILIKPFLQDFKF